MEKQENIGQQSHPGMASWCSQHGMRQLDCHPQHYPAAHGDSPVIEDLREVGSVEVCRCQYADGKWRFYDVKGNKIHVCGL